MITDDDNLPGETPARYGCLECQEDAELALADRLHPSAVARYRAHLRACGDCRRMNQLLEAVYRGPDPASSGLGTLRGSSSDREFAAILRRVSLERPLPWYQRAVQTTGVVALATTAAALALALVLPAADPSLEAEPLGGISAALQGARQVLRAAESSASEDSAVAPHQAQVDYGRVIAGRGFLSTRGDGPPVLTDTFTVGTRFSVEPGRITGFLGPNGAGKTTTLRMLLGLVRPTSGSATIGGQPYAHLRTPQHVVGAALEATNFHPGRSGRDHLRVMADTAHVDSGRVDEMLEMVGIPAAARQRAGGYSMGMRQRLALAGALLGDPQVLLLDEPANGLDPEGIRWLRMLLRHLSGQGKTILISSHMLSEVEQTVDDVVIIANGKLIRQGAIGDLPTEHVSTVRTSEPRQLIAALTTSGLQASEVDGSIQVVGRDLVRIGDVAFRAGLPIHELRTNENDLEKLFFELTSAEGNRNTEGAA